MRITAEFDGDVIPMGEALNLDEAMNMVEQRERDQTWPNGYELVIDGVELPLNFTERV